MSTITDSQEQYEQRVSNAWKNPANPRHQDGADSPDLVLGYGDSVRVSLSMMDGTQRAVFRKFEDDASGQLAYEHRLENAWRVAE